MSFDLEAVLRQAKPEKRVSVLRHRRRADLVLVERLTPKPMALVPDTMVYSDMAAGQMPAAVLEIMREATQFHSVVALSELAQGLAIYDPRHRAYDAVRSYYVGLFRQIPPERLVTPDNGTWLRAGVIVGILTRTQGYQPHQRKELYADALIYLSAAKSGLPVLTRNAADFDLLNQLHPTGRVIIY